MILPADSQSRRSIDSVAISAILDMLNESAQRRSITTARKFPSFQPIGMIDSLNHRSSFQKGTARGREKDNNDTRQLHNGAIEGTSPRDTRYPS